MRDPSRLKDAAFNLFLSISAADSVRQYRKLSKDAGRNRVLKSLGRLAHLSSILRILLPTLRVSCLRCLKNRVRGRKAKSHLPRGLQPQWCKDDMLQNRVNISVRPFKGTVNVGAASYMDLTTSVEACAA